MDKGEKIIYRLDDEIAFRKCTLYDDEPHMHQGDCTDYEVKQIDWGNKFYCKRGGIHFHCAKHPEIELDWVGDIYDISNGGYYQCPKCKNKIKDSFANISRRCMKQLNMEIFKHAKLVRLDDWYVSEVTEKVKTPSGYWVKSDVKTDKDGDSIIVLYVGYQGSKDKTQYFIKPEKLQLSSDHKDLDPATILSKIEVTLKDRTLTHKFDDKQD